MSSIRVKSKSLASDMLSKGFKPAKCKTTLKLAMSRIKLLKNKREVAVKQMRRELAQLLQSGQEKTASIRVEHVIREEKTMAAYDFIEIYCELIVARMPIIEAHKSCPIDLKEAIASMIFASPRCADLPELMDVRKQFLAKYGKDFVNSALEVRPDCGVSSLVVEKLSARTPEVEFKMKTLAAIAQEHNIKWDPTLFEEELKKPKEDILDGPSTSVNTNWMPEQSTYVKPSHTSNQNTESTKKKYDVSTSSDISSGANTSIPIRSQSEPSVAGQGPTHQEFNSSSASWNHPKWNMEFKDATSAAQAAAESAEKASLAARVAAELAIRGTFPKPSSADIPGTSTYHSRSQEPEAPKDSKPSPENHFNEYSIKENNKFRTSTGIQQHNQTFGRDEAAAACSSNDVPESYREDLRRPSGPSSFSKKDSANENVPEVHSQLGTDMQYSQTQTSEHWYKGDNSERQESRGMSGNDVYSNRTSDNLKGGFVYDNFEKPSTDLGEGSSPSANSHIKTEFVGNSDVFFDDYLSDNEADLSYATSKSENLLDMFSSRKGEKDAATEDRWSPKQKQSIDEKVKSSGFPTVSAIQDMQDTEIGEEDNPIAFDDSDGPEYEIEDVSGKAAIKLNDSLNHHTSFGRSSPTDSMNGNEEIRDANNGSPSPFITNAFRKSNGADLGFGKNSRDNDSSSGNEPPSTKSIYSSKGMTYRTSMDRPSNPGSSKAWLREKSESENRLDSESSPFSANDSQQSDFGNDSDKGLNLPKLRGGFRNKKTDKPPSDFDFSHDDLYEPKSDTMFSTSSRTSRTPRADTDQSNRRSHNEYPSLSLNKENEKSTPVEQNASQDGKLSGKKLRGTFLEDDWVEDKELGDSARSRTKDVKLSRRTRNTVSGPKDDVLSASEHQSYPPYTSDLEIKASHAKSGPESVEGRKRFNTLQEYSSGKQHTLAPSETEITKSPSTTRFGSLESRERLKSLQQHPSVSAKSTSETNSKGSASSSEKRENVGSKEGLTSRQNSFKNKSHVHPKLPDYDSLTAHFQQLRANRRA